jgi:hypothetical protein
MPLLSFKKPEMFIIGASPSFAQLAPASLSQVLPSPSPGYFALILLENGELYGIGANDLGQLGLGDLVHRSKITKVFFFSLASPSSLSSLLHPKICLRLRIGERHGDIPLPSQN